MLMVVLLPVRCSLAVYAAGFVGRVLVYSATAEVVQEIEHSSIIEIAVYVYTYDLIM